MKSPAPPTSRPGDPSPATLLHIRAAGHFCLITTLVIFIVLGIRYGKPYDQVWQLVLTHIVSGRAGNAGVGLEKGFNLFFLLYQSCMQDFIIMFYVYSWFVTGYQFVSKWPLVGPALKNIHELALEHKKRIAPYGAIGLMIFVIFPFWSTGPLVGVLVGYLLGMSTWLTFTMVIVGDIIAVAAWIWAYDMLRNYNQSLALVLLCIIFAGAIGGTLYTRILRTHKKDKIKTPNHPPEAEEGPTANEIGDANERRF